MYAELAKNSASAFHLQQRTISEHVWEHGSAYGPGDIVRSKKHGITID